MLVAIFASTAASAEPVKPRATPTKRAKPKQAPTPKVVSRVVPPCNADELQKRGDDQLAMAHYWAAAAEYQKAIDCAPTENRYLRAGFALCSVNRCKPPPQVKRYWEKLSPSGRDKLSQFCAAYDCGGGPYHDDREP